MIPSPLYKLILENQDLAILKSSLSSHHIVTIFLDTFLLFKFSALFIFKCLASMVTCLCDCACRGHQRALDPLGLESQIIANLVDAGNSIGDLWKSGQCSLVTCYGMLSNFCKVLCGTDTLAS